MKFPQVHTLAQIATIIDVDYIGDANFPIYGMNEIHVVKNGDIVFVDHPKYYQAALESAASVILINKEVECPEGKALLISEDPFSDFNKLTLFFKPFQKALSLVSSTAKIGNNTIIQPNVFIGNNVIIGENCLIHPNVTIYDNTIIGNNVTIHSNTVIGADAFYYKNRTNYRDKLISGGNVVIKDNVDIGASCTIDKGVSASTIIGKGTKLDNQVQIGHDTTIGEKCLFASQVGVAGCVVIENEVILWGQVGVKSGITIAERTEVFAQSGIVNPTTKNKKYFGSPAVEARDKFKELAYIKKLPEIIKKKK